MQAAPVIVFLSGLLAGVMHVISGPDHLVAIAPLTVRTPRAAPALGAAWGIGHGGGIAIWFAVAALGRAWYGVQLAPDALEALVGLSLMGLALLNWGEQQAPIHTQSGPLLAFLVGVLHGSAGGSHLLALLPTLGLAPPHLLAYASGYLSAGVLTMAGAASLLGRFSARLPDLRRMRRGCALLAAGLGAVWLLRSLSTFL
jgi:hypothetical protein